MYPDIGIVPMYRRSYGLSMIPDEQKTLIFQPANINGAPRDQKLSGVTPLKIIVVIFS